MSTLARFPIDPNPNPYLKRDHTFRILTGAFQQPAYAATIAVALWAARTVVQPAQLTGAVTFTTASVGDSTADDQGPFVGDEVEFLLVSDSSTRTATFGTGFQPNGTLAVTTGKYAYISFVFNGVVWQEKGRTVTA